MNLDYDTAWIIYNPVEARIKQKIKEKGVPLCDWNIRINFGIKTGFNDAFIITTEQKNALIAEDPKSAEIIRPILRGRDIQRFSYDFANLWLICTFPSRHYNIDDYPAIKKYLLSYGIERLEQSGKRYIIAGREVKARKKTNNMWFETQDSINYWNDFSRQKIIWKRIGSKLRFSYDNTGLLCLDSTCFATGDGIEYLVAVLNSIMGNYLLKESPKTGTGDLIISVQALEPIRIPKLQEHDQEPYKELLALILERIAQGKDCEDLEYKLNSLVFDAYGLSVEERQYVIDFATEAFR
ncbi:MAG: type II restriction endonuclease [Clostridia bacterium]|nr:type II restriction endonuclease [Clostridia bacterium]